TLDRVAVLPKPSPNTITWSVPTPMTARPTLALRPPREPRLAGAPWPPRESRPTLAPRLTGTAGRGARRTMPVTAPARATTICTPYIGIGPIASSRGGGVGRCARGELSGAVSQRTPSPARSSVATTATVSRRRWEREVLSEVISMSSSLGPVPGRHLPCAGETPPPPLARYASTGAIRAGAAHAPLCARIPPGRRPVEWWLICHPAMRGRLLCSAAAPLGHEDPVARADRQIGDEEDRQDHGPHHPERHHERQHSCHQRAQARTRLVLPQHAQQHDHVRVHGSDDLGGG